MNKGGMLLGRMGAISGGHRCVEEALNRPMHAAGFKPSNENAASSFSVTDAGHNEKANALGNLARGTAATATATAMSICWRGCRYGCCTPAVCAAAPRGPLMAAATRYAIEALEDTLRVWRIVHHTPTSRMQEQGRETLEEACLLLEAPNAKDAAKAFIMDRRGS